jgi:hypothetical protein
VTESRREYMKITKRQLRRIIKEEKSKLIREEQYDDYEGSDSYYEDQEEANRSRSEDPSTTANKLLDQTMTFLEKKLYGKYPDEEVDAFAVEAMEVMGGIEALLVKLIDGEYREDY